MAKRWAVTIHTIKKSGNTYTADLYELGTNLVSGKLTLRMNDTSTLKFSVGFNRFRDISPVKSLVEVRFGEGTSWDTKFFGTITKRSRNIVEGIESYEAVGVLGSYRFLPNYDGYTENSSLTDILDTEQMRFRGEWSSSDAHYTPSAWELLYQGQSWVPQNYGLLVHNFYYNAKMSCNLERIQKNSKNAYEFLKAITKDGAYINEMQYENGKWFEKGALAEFRPIVEGDRNDQNADYRYNLLTVTVEDSPSCSRVEAVNKGSKQVVTSGAYPNPFYSARIMASDKADGTTYTSAELQKIANNELLRGTRISEATCFDRHVIDDTIPWFDLSKYVYVRYAVGNTFALEEMQISEISYDLCDSTKDRVKLGAVQKALTDSMNAETNSLETSGGTMTGDIKFYGDVVKHDSLKNIDVDLVNAYEPLVAYGTEIPSNENLNTPTYVNVGLYYRADNATVATLSNCPTTVGFSMLVRNVNKTDVNSSAKTWQYLTREITDINGNQFIQTAFCGSTVGTWVFGEWKQIIVGRKTGTLTANVGSFDEAYCRQSGDTVDIHGWLVGLSTSVSSHANAIKVSGVSLPSVPIRFVFTCWLNNGIAAYAGYGVLDTYGNITFVKPVANANKVSFTITYVV